MHGSNYRFSAWCEILLVSKPQVADFSMKGGGKIFMSVVEEYRSVGDSEISRSSSIHGFGHVHIETVSF